MTKKFIDEIAARYVELGIKPCEALREWCKRPTDILILHRNYDGHDYVTRVGRNNGQPPPPIYETFGITETE